MYYDRVLSTEEELYISKAQQRIAQLTVLLARESAVNDVDDYKAELILELEYSINVLRSSLLDWSAEDIRMMMDYYSLRGGLIPFSFRAITFNPINAVPGGQIWATVPQLREVETNSVNYDAYLLSLIQQEVIDRTDYDAYLLGLITAANGGAITVEITAQETIGGIRAGTVFPIGTLLQDIWIQLLSTPASISNFTFDSYVELKEVGNDLTILEFTWDSEGAPQNLVINNSLGTMVDVPVSGGLATVSYVHSISSNQDLTWTLSGANVEPITITLKYRYPSYYGKETVASDTPVTVTEAKILAGTSYLQETAEEVSVVANTGNTEQGFIAVPKTQTVSSYTKWFVDNTNFSNILSGEFIITPTDVTVNGVIYAVYRWGYRSPLIGTIKLHR